MTGTRGEQGSIVLFALLVCLGIAVVVQTLSVVIVCATRAAVVESTGRALEGGKEGALAAARMDLLTAWQPRAWSAAPRDSPALSTMVASVPQSGGWVLDVTAAHDAAVSPVTVSAWVERGRDGVDLPWAGVVADSIVWAPARAAPLVEPDGVAAGGDDGAGAAALPVWLLAAPQSPAPGAGFSIHALRESWRLDEGWRTLFETWATNGNSTEAMAPVAGVRVVRGRSGTAVSLPADWGTAADEPGLLVVIGGASLDARGRGDVLGVIVVDGAGVSLDGTTVHGAVFATETVDFGTSGAVWPSIPTLRWATDRSLIRSRLVPGSRRESLQ